MYWMAPDKTKAQPLIEQAALLLQELIAEDEPSSDAAEVLELPQDSQ
jgi:hypothetical protein